MTSNEQTKTTLPRRLANRLLRRYNAAFTGAIALGGVLAPYAHHLKDAVMFPVGGVVHNRYLAACFVR